MALLDLRWASDQHRRRVQGRGPMANLLATLVLASSVISCAHVSQQYAAYEGRDAERQGNGGTKMSSDGIDFWTTGAPPRRYRILGLFTDSRRDQRIAAASFASDIAAKVKEVGSDAVIYLDESKEFVARTTKRMLLRPRTATGPTPQGRASASPSKTRLRRWWLSSTWSS